MSEEKFEWYRILPTFVIARAEKPVAIHCERRKEEKGHVMGNPNASNACSGLPRRSLGFPPRNDRVPCGAQRGIICVKKYF